MALSKRCEWREKKKKVANITWHNIVSQAYGSSQDLNNDDEKYQVIHLGMLLLLEIPFRDLKGWSDFKSR